MYFNTFSFNFQISSSSFWKSVLCVLEFLRVFLFCKIRPKEFFCCILRTAGIFLINVYLSVRRLLKIAMNFQKVQLEILYFFIHCLLYECVRQHCSFVLENVFERRCWMCSVINWKVSWGWQAIDLTRREWSKEKC